MMSNWKPITTTDTAIVEAYARGCRVTDDGRVISHVGNEKSLLVKRHRGGAYQSFTYTLGTRPNRKIVNIPLHRFIGYVLFGEAALQPGVKVYHENNQPLDNRPSNIKMGTQSDVMMARDEADRKRIAGSPHRRGGPRKGVST